MLVIGAVSGVAYVNPAPSGLASRSEMASAQRATGRYAQRSPYWCKRTAVERPDTVDVMVPEVQHYRAIGREYEADGRWPPERREAL